MMLTYTAVVIKLLNSNLDQGTRVERGDDNVQQDLLDD